MYLHYVQLSSQRIPFSMQIYGRSIYCWYLLKLLKLLDQIIPNNSLTLFMIEISLKAHKVKEQEIKGKHFH